MLLSIVSAILFAAMFVGFFRKKAAYGVIIIMASIAMRIMSLEVGNDLWWASCLFMLIGAGYCFYPVKSAKSHG